MAEYKAQKGREKRARQALRRSAVSINKVAVMGSSDSDGFIQVEIEDNLSTSSKSPTRRDKTSSSTDSENSAVKVRKATIEETGFVDDEIKKSKSDEELSHFAAGLHNPQGVVDQAMSSTSRRSGMVVDQAMSSTSDHPGMAGRRAAHVLCTSARPETPSAR
eukprot:277080-Amphidinium_carterae.1